MKKTSISYIGVAVSLAAVVLLAGSVSASVPARTNPNSGVNASTTPVPTASTTLKRVVKLDKVSINTQARADKEIDRRIVALNKLLNKIQGMEKISVTDKSSFATTVQEQINLLGNLKIKIDADVDVVTLKADVQSVTKTYRIYALVLPQIQIIAAADRLASTASLLSDYSAKLQARIMTDQTGGKNVSTLQSLLNEMNAKIADANAESAATIAGVVGLKSDNGDKTVMTINTAALKAARTSLRTGTQDVKDANKIGVKIRVGLKSVEETNATSTATTTASTTAR